MHTHARTEMPVLTGSRLRLGGGAVVVVLLACLWPLSAYAGDALVIPGALVLGIVALAIPRRPEYGVAIALALVPFLSYRPAVGNAILSRPVLAIALPALAFGLAAYGLYAPGRGRFASGWLGAVLLAFLAVAVVSALQAIDPRSSVRSIFILAIAVALAFAVMQLCHTREQLLVVTAGAVLGLALSGAQGIVQHFTSDHLFGFYSGGRIVTRVQGSFVHPNTYGAYVATLIPLAVGLAASRAAPRTLRTLGLVALALAIPALVLSYSRGAMVGLVAGSAIWSLRWRPRVTLAGVAVIAAVFLVLAPSTLRNRFNSSAASGDVGVRSDVWGAAVHVYDEHPVLGDGPANFPHAYATLGASGTPASERPLLNQGTAVTLPYHAHNLELGILSDEGAIGLAVFLALLAVGLRLIYRGCEVRDPAARAVCVGIGAAWATWLISSQADVAFFNEEAIAVLALAAVAAGFVALHHPEPALRRTASARRQA